MDLVVGIYAPHCDRFSYSDVGESDPSSKAQGTGVVVGETVLSQLWGLEGVLQAALWKVVGLLRRRLRRGFDLVCLGWGWDWWLGRQPVPSARRGLQLMTSEHQRKLQVVEAEQYWLPILLQGQQSGLTWLDFLSPAQSYEVRDAGCGAGWLAACRLREFHPSLAMYRHGSRALWRVPPLPAG